MRRIESHPIIFGLLLCFICCAVAPSTRVAQTPVKEKQVDVITIDPGRTLGREKMTVDVREVAHNLCNEEMYNKAIEVLTFADNAYLSSGTINLLKTALNDDSARVRQGAIILLGLSRNPEAIEIISNRLQSDPAREVRYDAAKALGRLAGEAAVPTLEIALTEDRTIGTGVIVGLSWAGGKAVPLLIQILKTEIKYRGGDSAASLIIQSLRDTGDRRVIKPLLDIISHPVSPSTSTTNNMDEVRLNAATALAHFATDWNYEGILESRNKFAEGYPVTPRENRRVNASDRTRIFEALKTAGYDINRLAERFVRYIH